MWLFGRGFWPCVVDFPAKPTLLGKSGLADWKSSKWWATFNWANQNTNSNNKIKRSTNVLIYERPLFYEKIEKTLENFFNFCSHSFFFIIISSDRKFIHYLQGFIIENEIPKGQNWIFACVLAFTTLSVPFQTFIVIVPLMLVIVVVFVGIVGGSAIVVVVVVGAVVFFLFFYRKTRYN